MKDNGFTDYIVYDILGHVQNITTKKLFYSKDIYLDGKIVAFVADGELYFKSDKNLVEKYLALGCHQFTYTKGDKTIAMNYVSATEEMIENREIMSDRLNESYEIGFK